MNAIDLFLPRDCTFLCVQWNHFLIELANLTFQIFPHSLHKNWIVYGEMPKDLKLRMKDRTVIGWRLKCEFQSTVKSH
ncbi:CLUMA_CG016891, isoform A [Clunio marinus]|uniref:CLUMA_CG016891, isoform A n=1 Tax=Clunio marinus TaxID=568069 RepID=A0A1J1ITZ3_9DIPT|nr:CLUMA_CG016891, isoform A [Clunio marinus]